jgi:hypothetical protein
MAALAPQKRQCELESFYPAGTLVKPPLPQAAGYGQVFWKIAPKYEKF